MHFLPLRILDWVSDCALGVTVVVTSSAVLIQVVMRFVFNDPIGWVDEFASMLFIWMAMIGTAIVLRDDSHMAVEVFFNAVPQPIRVAFFTLKSVLVLMSLGVLAVFGVELLSKMSFIEFPAMGISRGFLYAVFPVLAPLMIVNALRNIVHFARNQGRRKPPRQSEG